MKAASTSNRNNTSQAAQPLPWSHLWLDQLGLRYHEAIAEKLRANPALRQVAIDNIDRWLARNDYPLSVQRSLLQWRDLLTRASLEELTDKLLDPSEDGYQRRQNTPFPGILTQEERRAIRHSMSHQSLDDLALLYFKAIAEKIRQDPSLLRIPLENIKRWREQGSISPGSEPGIRVWENLIRAGDLEALTTLMTDPGERGARWRQYPVFVGILTPEESAAIRRQHKANALTETVHRVPMSRSYSS
jgi:CRISPR/Cas system-associated endoribonuclease Cas2